MIVIDLLSLATRMFKTRPMRTFLTILGVGVGIGTVLFLVSLGYGLQEAILHRIATADSLLSLDVNPGPSESLALTDDTVEMIRGLPQIQEVSRQKTFTAQITIDAVTGNGQVIAVDDSIFRLRGISPLVGRLFGEELGSGAVVSSATARLFSVPPESMIGKTMSAALLLTSHGPDGKESILSVTLPHHYTITGMIDDESASYVYVPLRSVQSIGLRGYDQLKVRVTESKYLDAVRDSLLDGGYVVAAISDTIEQASKIFNVVQIVLALFGLVALTVSAIGMFNTMTITLLERTNEIGSMRSIGISGRDIRMLFLVESMLMGFLGGLGGILMGSVAGFIANAGFNALAGHFGGQAMQLFVTPIWFVIVIIVFSTVIGFITGIYPSFKASTLNPLDALRYK